MTAPDNPYASPPREQEGGERRPDRPPQGWGPPTGSPAGGPAPAPPSRPGPGAGGLGVAALVMGLLAVVLGVSVVGGVLLGSFAIALGVQGRARARTAGGTSGLATAGVVLGLLGLVVAAATYLWLRDDLAEYRTCRALSLSPAQDQQCDRDLRRGIEGG